MSEAYEAWQQRYVEDQKVKSQDDGLEEIRDLFSDMESQLDELQVAMTKLRNAIESVTKKG